MRSKNRLSILFPLLLAAAAGCAGGDQAARVEAVLNDFHAAAAEADEERYFRHFSVSGVFLGTDAGERWTVAEFRDFVHPFFSRGQGWTYKPVRRHVHVAGDGRTAWFDEALMNDSYGECRGSGVLRRSGDGWKIEQYNLSIPIPNEIARDVVAQIRALAGAGDKE